MTPTMYRVAELAEKERHNKADEDISARGNILSLVSNLLGSGIKAAGSVVGGIAKGKGGKK